MADDPRPEPRTAGMIALVPTAEDAERLAVQGGDDPDALHLTLVYLGDDVTGWDDDVVDALTADLDEHTTQLGGPLAARVMGHAQFNPDGGPNGDLDPCAVYLVGETSEVGPLRDSVLDLLARHGLPVAEQHTPFQPHVTGGYQLGPTALSETGPVTFDRLRLALGDQEIDVPLGEGFAELGDDYEPPTPVPVDEVEVKGNVATSRRHKLAEQGHTLRKEDENYPIGNLKDLDNAIQAWGRAKEADRAAVKRHLLAEARRLKASEETVKKIRALGDSKELPADGVETKAMSPDPRAAKLRKYWVAQYGKKWRKFRQLRRHLAKYVHTPRMLNGLTANIYKLATGRWPGKRRGDKAGLPAGVQFKMLFDDPAVDVAGDVDPEEQAMCEGIDEWGGEFLDGADDVEDPDGDVDDEQEETGPGPIEARVGEKAARPGGLVTIPPSDLLPDLFPDGDSDDPDGVDRLMLDADAAILAGDQVVTADGEDPDDEDWIDVAGRDKQWRMSGDAVLEPVEDDEDRWRHAPPAAVL